MRRCPNPAWRESSRPGLGFRQWQFYDRAGSVAVGMVAAVVDGVDFSPAARARTMHLAGHGVEMADRESSFRDPRLIGHHEHQQVELRESRARAPSDPGRNENSRRRRRRITVPNSG